MPGNPLVMETQQGVSSLPCNLTSPAARAEEVRTHGKKETSPSGKLYNSRAPERLGPGMKLQQMKEEGKGFCLPHSFVVSRWGFLYDREVTGRSAAFHRSRGSSRTPSRPRQAVGLLRLSSRAFW